jgi:UDPglucose--hexose-1-phosphate uridylyltransferase
MDQQKNNLKANEEPSLTETRWDPTLKQWVVIAAHRQGRPQMPKDWCPFCPGSGKVPSNYDVYLYANDFATFTFDAPEPESSSTALYPTGKAQGICDVVLYHPDHNTSLPQLSHEHIVKLINLWRKRFLELQAMPEIKYIFIFENKGEVIGVTMPHPHGQIYAFPFVPPKAETELKAAQEHFAKYGKCLFCEILERELNDQERIVAENAAFLAFVPFYAHWPYEVHIYAKRHLQNITEFNEQEINDFAEMLKIVTQKYDNLYGFSFPYMMIMHQAPVNTDYGVYHFHVEFYPPHRSEKKLKYLAGCESGAGTYINDTIPELKAAELRSTKPN